MVRPVIGVLIVLIGFLYSAFFMMWNAETKVNVVTIGIVNPPWWIADLPIGMLPVLGAVVGVVAMAIAAWLPWSSARKASKLSQQKLQKAIDKFNEQKEILKARNERIVKLQDELTALEARITEGPAEGEDQAEEMAAAIDGQPADEGDDESDAGPEII